MVARAILAGSQLVCNYCVMEPDNSADIKYVSDWTINSYGCHPLCEGHPHMSAECRLRLVLYQDVPGLWVGRGLEHDISAEGRTMAETIRAIFRMIAAHSAFDARHARAPLSAFRPAAQTYWNAFHGGTVVPLSQLGVLSPLHWEISVAIAQHRPTATRLPVATRAHA
jgi:hypothetical protein